MKKEDEPSELKASCRRLSEFVDGDRLDCSTVDIVVVLDALSSSIQTVENLSGDIAILKNLFAISSHMNAVMASPIDEKREATEEELSEIKSLANDLAKQVLEYGVAVLGRIE